MDMACHMASGLNAWVFGSLCRQHKPVLSIDLSLENKTSRTRLRAYAKVITLRIHTHMWWRNCLRKKVSRYLKFCSGGVAKK